ncbi:MFS general substrate transporter [Cytidiella melzeri]|nr:MFS general substrate transporter [Cytidiella melzeri]
MLEDSGIHRRRTYARNALICIAVAANALCAGGVYSFPLISPALAALHFTQPQITTIALAGMVGQYPFAALVGKVLDGHGPGACSFIAGVLFSSGFGLFSREISNASESASIPDAWVFRRCFVYFGMIGLGTVFSYFSVVFAATSTFPRYNGIASGTSMALFGSSPLLLTMIATRHFSAGEGAIDVTHFLTFMAMLTAATHVFGTVALLVQPNKPVGLPEEPVIIVTDVGEENCSLALEGSSPSEEDNGEESSALLTQIKRVAAGTQTFPVPEPQHGSVLDLLRDCHFWVLAFVATVVFGSSEMVMANLASIFLSLPSHADVRNNPTIATQIQLLAIANTTSRLLVGPLSDLLSPVASYMRLHASHPELHPADTQPTPEYVYSFPHKQIISRIAFLVACNSILLATFSFVDLFARSTETLWVMSIGVGFAYGGTFTILPGILVSIWGAPNLGRNFGIISYAPFFGTSMFSYLYAFIVEQHSTLPSGEGHGSCEGVPCWQSTFTGRSR